MNWNLDEQEPIFITDNFTQEALDTNRNVITGSRRTRTLSFCHNLLGDKSLFTKLNELHLDMVILDSIPLLKCYVILPYRLGIAHVSLTTQYDPWVWRIPALPSLVPFPMATEYSQNMTFVERLSNLWTMLDWAFCPNVAQMDDTLVKKYAADKPFVPMLELTRRSLLWLVNTDNSLDYPRPTMPNVIYTGGLTTRPPSQLPETLDKTLKRSTNGVILVSFGTAIKKLPSVISHKFVQAFTQVNYTFIWKYQGPKLETSGNNIIFREWVPQNDILGHPNTKLFLTHCGSNGQFEALYHGIPMIGFPFFSEQRYNARRIEFRGYGIKMKVKEFTVKELVANINNILTNQTVKENIRKGSRLFRSQPLHPLARATYWIEHVLEFGGDHLRSHALDMPWYQYAMLDILFCIICLMIVMFMAITRVLWCIFGKICNRNKLEMGKQD